MKNYMGLLRRAKIFRGMEEKNILSMLDCLAAVKKRFTRGEFLYRAGEPAGMAALVLDGMFHIDGRITGEITAFWRTSLQENCLGEVYSFLDDEPVRINAVAVKDSTVLLLDVKKIFQVCSNGMSVSRSADPQFCLCTGSQEPRADTQAGTYVAADDTG